jgi:hypothetical protein
MNVTLFRFVRSATNQLTSPFHRKRIEDNRPWHLTLFICEMITLAVVTR